MVVYMDTMGYSFHSHFHARDSLTHSRRSPEGPERNYHAVLNMTPRCLTHRTERDVPTTGKDNIENSILNSYKENIESMPKPLHPKPWLQHIPQNGIFCPVETKP